MNYSTNKKIMMSLRNIALNIEYLKEIIEFCLHFRGLLPPSFTKQTPQNKNANSSVSKIKSWKTSIITYTDLKIMRRDEQNIHIPKAVFCICTTMVTSIHKKRSGML
jgi:hypothetical protein